MKDYLIKATQTSIKTPTLNLGQLGVIYITNSKLLQRQMKKTKRNQDYFEDIQILQDSKNGRDTTSKTSKYNK